MVSTSNQEPNSNIRYLHPSPAQEPSKTADDQVDERLIVAAQKGDLNAFNELVTRHERAVFSVCMRLLRDVSAAEDAAQDTFIRAWSAIDSFRGGLVRPWLLRIVVNETRNLQRGRSRRSDRELRVVREEARLAPGPDPAEVAVGEERRTALLGAIRALPEELRLVITCRYLLELSETETAESLDIPTGTVKSRLHRGLARLREGLPDV